jgi:hypothetical protein
MLNKEWLDFESDTDQVKRCNAKAYNVSVNFDSKKIRQLMYNRR